MLYGTKGNNLILSTSYSEWDANLYPRVRLYNSGGTELGASPKDLTYFANGTYCNSSWIPSASGYYQAIYLTYTDSVHTVSSQNYGIASEAVKVDSTTSDITYISSQMIALSSQIKSSTYGGGGGTYVVPGGKKSPWTHAQRDEVINNVSEIKKTIEIMNKNLAIYYNEEMNGINILLDNLEKVHNELKTSERAHSDKILSQLEYSIKVLKENREKLKNINIIAEIPNIKKNIDDVRRMASMLLTNEMIEQLVVENKKEEKKDG